MHCDLLLGTHAPCGPTRFTIAKKPTEGHPFDPQALTAARGNACLQTKVERSSKAAIPSTADIITTKLPTVHATETNSQQMHVRSHRNATAAAAATDSIGTPTLPSQIRHMILVHFIKHPDIADVKIRPLRTEPAGSGEHLDDITLAADVTAMGVMNEAHRALCVHRLYENVPCTCVAHVDATQSRSSLRQFCRQRA